MTKIFGHRGFSGKYPENTMLAFRKAVELGIDGIELDVHFSKDKELVIIHDELIDRTTNGTGLVADYTLKELKEFDASATFTGVYGKNEIPTLREYFELVKDLPNFVTNIELKTGVNEYHGIEKAVLDMINEYNLKDRIIISSFNHFSVLRFKELCPEMKCGFLEESWIVDMGAYTKKHGIECVHPIFCNLTDEHYAEMKANGRAVNTWTVNEKEDMRRLMSMGVDTIIGNFPDRALEVAAEMK